MSHGQIKVKLHELKKPKQLGRQLQLKLKYQLFDVVRILSRINERSEELKNHFIGVNLIK